MEQLIVVALLVALCSATSPTFPSIIPLDCNETQFEVGVAMDLINGDRDEGFVLRPVRVVSVTLQESVKFRGGFFYYVDTDVTETEHHVLSGKTWKDSTHDIPAHEMVFGHCKATIFIAKAWRIYKLLNYNCTTGTVPPRSIVMMCPDCPTLVTDINSNIKTKADHLVEQFNLDSNETHHFKVDDIERVRTQYVSGQSYFFKFTIVETECLKTQPDVNLANCKSLKDHEAHVGYCTGSVYNTPVRKEAVRKEGFHVSCEIYDPVDDDSHKHCDHGPERSKTEQGQEKSNPDEKQVKQESTGEAAGQGEAAPAKCEHGHCRRHRGHKHHRCGPDHHHHHHHPHTHHHHHHHDHLNDSHPHDPSHHHHHHHDHDHHNHTRDGSSSEEHTDKKPSEKRSKGSVQFYYPSGDQTNVPVPTIVSQPPPPERPGKHGKFGKHDNIEFPSERSKLNTCPGEPLVQLPRIVTEHLFV